MELFHWLDNLAFISNYEIIEFEQWATGFYYKIRIELNNQSLMFAKEYSDYYERNYSFHWQRNTGELIIRWDNAHHHKTLDNYPHHRHEKDRVTSSEEFTLEKALKFIELHISSEQE